MKIGMVILCVMGCVWAAWSLGAAHITPWAYMAAGLLALGPMMVARRRRFPPSTAEQVRRVRRVVGLASAFEVVVIFGGIQLLVRAGRPDLIVCLIALVVGLHFLPLARWLPAPTYYLTGLAMLIAAGAGLVVPAADRIVLVAGSCAAILWLTAWAIAMALPRPEAQHA